MTMRTLALLMIALTLSGCCCGSCGKKAENLVAEAPATIDDAKKRAKPPEVTVDVERITRGSGGGGACHSAVCLIILPVLLFEAIFPEKYDVVTVKDHGVEVFSGTYKTSGALLNGVVHLEGGERKEVLALTLHALDKALIVQTARVKPGPDGGTTRVPTSLQSQHDFIADYRKALEAEPDDDKRGALIAEALQWLDVEGLPLVVERLADPKEKDRARAPVVKEVCDVHPFTPSAHETAVLAAIAAHLGPDTALAAYPCAEDDTRRGVLVTALVTGTCTEIDATHVHRLQKAAMDLLRDKPQLKPAISATAKTCPPAIAALFALQLNEPVDRAGLCELLRSAHVGTALPYVRLENAAQRGGYFDALASGEQTEKLLEALHDVKLTPDELAQLTRAYVVDRSFFSRNPIRARVLHAMKDHSQGVDSRPARAVAAAARDKASDGDKPVFEVALLVLGDSSRVAAASKGAERPMKEDQRGVHSDGALVNYGLTLSGCTEEELIAFVSKSGSQKGPLSCSGWAKK